MKTAIPYAEKLMSLLSGSPEVKVLIEREKQKTEDDKKQARIDCLARIKTLKQTEIEAKQKLDLATSAVMAAEAKVKELKAKVAPTFTAHTEAQRKHGAAMSELSALHGEGEVSKTLYRLQRLILQTERQISVLEDDKKSTFRDADGRVSFRLVSPNVALNQQVLKQRLEVQKRLYEKAKEFVEAEMAPSEIKALCGQICKAIGQPLPAEETDANGVQAGGQS